VTTPEKTTPEKPIVAEHGARVLGDSRERLAAQMVAAYQQGESIRALAQRHGRAYGSVHRMLEGRVEFRPRGGARL